MRSKIDWYWYKLVSWLAFRFNSGRLHNYADELFERGYERYVLYSEDYDADQARLEKDC